MTTRRITALAAATTIGAGVLAGGAVTASTASAGTTTKATAFVTPDGKIACAYDHRDHHTKCVNTTSGWSHEKKIGPLRDADGNLVAKAPFVVTVDNKHGVGTPGVSTEGPSFDRVKAQGWHGKKDAIKHVRINTNGYGPYVNQDFAVAKVGQKLTFPDGLVFTVYGNHDVDVMTHPGKGMNVPWSVSAEGIANDDPGRN